MKKRLCVYGWFAGLGLSGLDMYTSTQITRQQPLKKSALSCSATHLLSRPFMQTGLADQNFVCLSVMTCSDPSSLLVLLAVRNKQVFVGRKLTAYLGWVHMQGSEVGWPLPFGSRMFESTIMFSPLNTRVWARCACLVGGGVELV